MIALVHLLTHLCVTNFGVALRDPAPSSVKIVRTDLLCMASVVKHTSMAAPSSSLVLPLLLEIIIILPIEATDCVNVGQWAFLYGDISRKGLSARSYSACISFYRAIGEFEKWGP